MVSHLVKMQPRTPCFFAMLAQPAVLSTSRGLCYRVVDQDGVQLVTDTVSYELLKGSTVDYTTDLIRSAFEVGLGSQVTSQRHHALRASAAWHCCWWLPGFPIQNWGPHAG